MDLSLNGRVALVTGATVGIGRATAILLAAEGATVVAVGWRGDELTSLSHEIVAAGGANPLVVAGDLLDPSTSSRVHETVQRELGRLDVLANVAGAGDQPGGVLTEEIWQRQFELNFHQKRRLSETFLPMLKESGQGRIINFAGLLEPTMVLAAQAASAACILWSKALSATVAADGITVNCITPGRVESEQVTRAFPTEESRQDFIRGRIPAGRFGTADEAAALVAFLASNAAAYITGETVSVDGGMHRST